MRFDEPHLAREKPAHLGAHVLAVTAEIGLVVGKEIGVGADALAGGAGIEHDADDAQETIVFDYQGTLDRHGDHSRGAHGASGSRSSSSACSTRAFIL